LVFSSFKGWVNSRALVRPEGLGKLKIKLIGIRTLDLPACSVITQPTTLVPQS
jgi:hypothetical protein